MQVQYLDRDATQMHADWRAGRCIHCSTGDKDGCLARYCDSCSQYWLATVGNDNGEGLPVKETCPPCIAEGFGTLDETIAWLRIQGDRIATEVSAEYSAKFDGAASEVLANLQGAIDRRQRQTPVEIDRRAA